MSYIESSKVLRHVDRMMAWRGNGKPAPVTIEWDLSNRCALGCMDCHFAHTHSRGPWVSRGRIFPGNFDPGGDLADETLVRRGLQQVSEAGVKGIVWSGGGDPTTHPRLLDIVEWADKQKLQQGMYTFGGLLTRESEVVLGETLSWVVVSLDCVDAETYAKEKGVPAARFEDACRGIQALSGRKAVVGISFLLHADNWMRWPEMLSLRRTLGASYVTLRPAIRTSPANPAVCTDDRQWITSAIRELHLAKKDPHVEVDISRFEEYRDWTKRSYETCYGIRFNATITPDGRVWVCPQRRGILGSCIGDLRTESFKTLWERHPGKWTDFSGCRVMCRLHLINETLAKVYDPQMHEAFL